MAAVKKPDNKAEIRVSLLPDNGSSAKDAARKRVYLIFLIFLAIILGIGGVSGYLRFQAGRMRIDASARRGAIRAVATRMQQAETEFAKVRNIGGVAGFAKNLVDAHLAAENIFETLEDTVIPEVALTHIAADGKGVIILTGRAKDFSAVARQIRVWKEYREIKDIKVSGIQTVIGLQGKVEGVDFNATLAFLPSVLAWKP